MKYEAPKAKIVDFKGEYVMASKTSGDYGATNDDGRIRSWKDLVDYWNDAFH
jgi:hypothetical protein